MSKKIHSEEHIAKLKATLGPRIKAARRAKGLTQEGAADRIGISAEFYARMERGHAMPSVPTLGRIATVLDVTVDFLFGVDTPLELVAPMPPLQPTKDPRQLDYIVEQARGDADMTRMLISLLKLCAKLDKKSRSI